MLFARDFLGLSVLSTLATLCVGTEARDPNQTPLAVHAAEFERYCGFETELEYPCFTLSSGDLKNVAIVANRGARRLSAHNDVLVKNARMNDFTIRPPFDAFDLTFRGTSGCRLRFAKADPGCFKITLDAEPDQKWRIWLADDNDGQKDLDTLNYASDGATFCGKKWFYIHVARDGK